MWLPGKRADHSTRNFTIRPAFVRVMKRILIAFLAAAFATSAFAGITYKFNSTTTGMAEKTFAGVVKSDGAKSRIDVTESDDTMFPAGAIVFSNNGTLTVFDPSKKTYYSLDLDKYVQQSLGLAQMSPFVKMDFGNPKTSVHDDGAGGTIAGYPTHRSTITTSFDIASSLLGGEQMKVTITSSSRIWLTDKLPASAASIFQTSRARTGVPAIDKVLESTASLKGFPVKQVTESRVSVNGGDEMTSTTTSTVSDVNANANVPASDLAMPSGYTKVDDPLASALKNMGID